MPPVTNPRSTRYSPVYPGTAPLTPAGTRPDAGRACRDAFHTHMKTCAHHGISFWNYLGDRVGIPGADRVPWLPDLARQFPRSAPLPAP